MIETSDLRAELGALVNRFASSSTTRRGTVVMVADYDDGFVRGDDGLWRFARRTVTLVFGTYPHLRRG